MKTFKSLLALAVMLFVLASCSGPGIQAGTIYMTGVLRKQLPITTNGYWEVSTANFWLQASPRSGFGNAVVDLAVDPSYLVPGEHRSAVMLEMPGQPTQIVSLVFAFPRLRGSVVMGPASTENPIALSSQSLPSGPGRLLIGFQGQEQSRLSFTSTGRVRRLAIDALENRPGMHLQQTIERANVAVVEVSDMRTAAANLRREPNVAYVERDLVLQPLAFDDYRTQQWSHTVMNVEEAWITGARGVGVDVAVIDGGFEPGHPDFGDNIASTYDFVSESTDITSRPNCDPHGEHVAGIIAAEADATGIDGVSPDVRLHLFNVASSEATSCPLYTSDIVEALYWVAGDAASAGPRADIVNLSLGGPHSSTLQAAVEAAYQAGVTLVAASGNSPRDNVLYPAAYPEVIAVSATGRWDEIATYSTTGPEVFLSAPGGNGSDFVISTAYKYVGGSLDYTFLGMQGTSMASPAVAAVAALMKSVEPTLTPVAIAGILADSSVDLGLPGRDDEFGYGRVDAYAAVTRAQALSGEPGGYVLRVDGTAYPIPAAENFIAGYVGGTITAEVGSDEDWDGVLNEPDEYYGEWTGEVQFIGEFFDIEVAVE